jgi:transcriptional regulator with XRE-family HTH domain
MSPLLKQLKMRRIALNLKQHDMLLRVGISRQQYQRLESKGNPRLDTLELLARGFNCQLMLIPQEKLRAVEAVLNEKNQPQEEQDSLVSNPWQNLLEDDE